jgi:hypothetical protein
MTRAETITLAIDAGFIPMTSKEMDMFEAFAKLIAEKEREACAKVIDSEAKKFGLCAYYANAIRARGRA